MPVVKRLVEPIHCSRAPIPKGVKNDLEAVCVNTLCGVILQLSSVAKHAEGIFSEIFIEANNIHQRTCSVQQRLDQLAIKVTKLDSAGEEISLQEINIKKAFKMTVHSDQQVLSRQTLPEAMVESYNRCQPVPDLASLTKYRHDGKDALKFYTDPSYFFELWKEKMNVEFEKRRKKKKRGNRGKKREEKKVVKGVKKKELGKNIPDWEIGSAPGAPGAEPAAISVDEDLPDISPESTASSISGRTVSVKRGSNASVVERPNVAPPPPPPGASPAKTPYTPADQQAPPSHIKPINLPPPPPPPNFQGQVPMPPPPPNLDYAPTAGGVPAGPTVCPPPPPPPPMMPGMASAPAAPPPPPPGAGAPALSSSILQNVVLSAPRPAPEPVVDSRNDLLSAIRDGMNLRKTQQVTEEEKQQVGMGNDVASILARRVALEFSDSEGDSDYSDDGDWSDD